MKLELDELVRAVEVNKDAPHCVLLGAGASITSGVPSASTCIWLWKRSIFLSRNPGLEKQFSDISLQSVRNRIQAWLDSEGGFPALGSSEEYGFYAEKCYPIAQNRAQFFHNLIRAAKPHVGYELLTLLAESELIRSVWTTNFDGLPAKAASAGNVTPIEIGLDSNQRITRPPRRGELWCVALHGDYRYDPLKNTASEIRDSDKELHSHLARQLHDHTLIVCGYSGRDQSVMDSLKAAYSQRGPGYLFWCLHENEEPAPSVVDLVETARANGREAFIVSSNGFDDLMVRIALNSLKGALLEKAKVVCAAKFFRSESHIPSFSLTAPHTRGVIRSNLFPIECPSELLQFKASGFDEKGAWQKLRQVTQGPNVAAVLKGGHVLALGTVDGVKDAFQGLISTDIARTPIDDREWRYTDGVIVSLLTQALLKAVAAQTGLNTDGRHTLWAVQPYTQLTIDGLSCRAFDAASLSLRRVQNKNYLVIKPTVKGLAPDGSELDVERAKELKRQLLTRQWNRQFDEALEKWRTLLMPTPQTAYEFPNRSGSTFRFKISTDAALGKILTYQQNGSIKLPPAIEAHVAFTGGQFREPKLLFSNKAGSAPLAYEHPLKGLLLNRPYDFSLTTRGIASEVRVGVVCPAPDSNSAASYLTRLNEKHRATTKEEYLPEFPGFAQVFGVPLDLPRPRNGAWAECREPSQGISPVKGAQELRQSIAAALEQIRASSSPHVIVVYIPDRWKLWESYTEGNEHFDLHDFIKAYCVQRGIATQFLRERTLRKSHQGEVVWWLALSLYVKSMRTPWALETLSNDTAFVGLGFSVDETRPKGSHVILGCSHIYNAEGVGLSYKLSKIENPTFIQGNPFMSRDDAHRVAESIRQQFYDSVQSLPKRVVIHKRTPFLKDEKEGLLEGLAGVEFVDMIEVNVEPAQRYVAYRLARAGNVYPDAFPVRRGSTLVLDKRKALIWVHGTSDAVHPEKVYYLGKSRIPAPLSITRHFGTSQLSDLAKEILGLSKMSLNSFDLYTKLPATLKSSNEIARIGSLLERFGSVPYDYRLFI